jgi:hypothetical protein
MGILDSPSLSGSPQWAVYDIAPTNQEHDLFESTIVEGCDIFGIEIYYYCLNPTFDQLYGEDSNLKYYDASLTKAIYKPGDEPTLYGQWGMLSDELIEKLQIPKFTFSRDISAADHPEIGDVIRVPWNQSKTNSEIIYEVTDVDEEGNIFQTKKFAWEVTLKPMRGSEDSNVVDLSGELDSVPISAGSDNDIIETEGDLIDDYTSLPTVDDIYGYR